MADKKPIDTDTAEPQLTAAPDSAAVLDQLSHILSSPSFRDAPTLKRFLTFVVEETLSRPTERLNATKIASGVFGRGPDFDNAEDAIVRVTANRLRRRLALYYATQGAVRDVEIRLDPGSYRPVLDHRDRAKFTSGSSDLLDTIQAYHTVVGRSIFNETYQRVRQRLAIEPDDGLALAAQAELALDAYGLDYHDVPIDLDDAVEALGRAHDRVADNPYIQFVRGLFAIHQNDLNLIVKSGRTIVKRGHPDRIIHAWGLTLIALTDSPRQVAATYDLENPETVDYPGWLFFPKFLAHYRLGDYEAALSAAIELAMPRYMGTALSRTAALAQLGMEDAARLELQKIDRLNPHFTRNPDRFLKLTVPDLDTVEHILEGLEKAGLRKLGD